MEISNKEVIKMIEVDYNDYKRILEENMRLIPENHKLKEEIERLNNIIKELWEYLEEKSNHCTLDDDDLLDVREKMKELLELKGEDKE